MPTLRPCLLAAALAVAGSFPGRAAAEEPQAFLDAIAAANKQLKAAGFRCAESLPAVLAGNREELPRFRNACGEAARAVDSATRTVKGLAVPDSDSARAFHAAELKFLEFQQRLVSRDLPELIVVLDNEKLEPGERRRQAEALVDRMIREEREQLTGLREARERFVTEHHLKNP